MASVLGPAVGAHCAAHSKRCLAWAGRLAGAQLPRYQADFPRQAAAASPVSPESLTARCTPCGEPEAQRLRRSLDGVFPFVQVRHRGAAAHDAAQLLLVRAAASCYGCARLLPLVRRCRKGLPMAARASFLGAAARCALWHSSLLRYVQWVPNSDVVVAQNRSNLCVW